MAATLNDVRNFFEIPMNKFRTEWVALSDQDKDEIKKGIGDGSLTY